jgi:hypothetical protein
MQKQLKQRSSKSSAKRFKARAIDGKVAARELKSRFEKARKLGEQLKEKRIVSQKFLDREVSI